VNRFSDSSGEKTASGGKGAFFVMKRKFLLQLLLATFVATSLRPDGFSQTLFGVRFSGSHQEVLPADFEADRVSVSFGSFLGKDVDAKKTVYLGIDYASFRVRSQPGGEIYSRQFIPWLGLRYYLQPRFREKVSPVLVVEVFKTYTRLKHSQGAVYSDGDLEYLERLYAPWGFVPSFSAEYVYSSALSLSGQAGLKFSYSKASISGSSNFQEGETRSRSVLGFVSVILNFRWQRR
jgi:hypothetical protein